MYTISLAGSNNEYLLARANTYKPSAHTTQHVKSHHCGFLPSPNAQGGHGQCNVQLWVPCFTKCKEGTGLLYHQMLKEATGSAVSIIAAQGMTTTAINGRKQPAHASARRQSTNRPV
jgi:hypothetical protein